MELLLEGCERTQKGMAEDGRLGRYSDAKI